VAQPSRLERVTLPTTRVWGAAKARRSGLSAARLDENSVAGTTGAPLGAETGAAPPDWRGLLDLLEDKTGKPFDDLWRTWVVRPDEAHLLDERAAARARYDEVVKRAGTWALPAVVRQAMRAWQFAEATQLLDAADRALDDRDSVTAAASAAGLTVPRTLRAAFEGGPGFSGMTAEADAELATIGLSRPRRRRGRHSSTRSSRSGCGTPPTEDLGRAKTAFIDGHLRDSVEGELVGFGAAWVDARDLGRIGS
jgi:hypothetical protein